MNHLAAGCPLGTTSMPNLPISPHMGLIEEIKISHNRRDNSKESDAVDLNQAEKLFTQSESPTLDALKLL